MNNAKELVDFAKDNIGVPYFYSLKMELLTNKKAITLANEFPSIVTPNYLSKAIARNQFGKINTDNIGLISAFLKTDLTIPKLYRNAKSILPIESFHDFGDGVIVYRRGHVGIFYHNLNKEPIVIEAKDINSGTTFSKFNPKKWECGLTIFSLQYLYDKKIPSLSVNKYSNPYDVPSFILKEGMKSEAIKWLQIELTRSGYYTSITGEFDKETIKSLLDFKRDSYLPLTKEVKEDTINALIGD